VVVTFDDVRPNKPCAAWLGNHMVSEVYVNEEFQPGAAVGSKFVTTRVWSS
jgi:hypothetical protein